MSIVYRERERERERERDRDRYEDSRSSFSSAQRGGNYTTTKQYRVRDDDTFSTTLDGRRYGATPRAKEPFAQVEETRVVRREREEAEPRSEVSYARREREPVSESRWQDDIVIRRSKESEEPPRRELRREEPPSREFRREEPSSRDRELVIRRTSERDGYEHEREFPMERYEDRRKEYRDYDVISPQRENFGDLQRYSRTAEYYSQPNQPQTIIIRNEPIVIREKVRDDGFAMIQRSEVEDRQVSRREPSPVKKDEFYYEKTVEKRDARPTEKEEDFYSRKETKETREVSPGDSISQVGARRRSRSRGRSRHSESDESLVYVRKETRESRGSSRSSSPGHRRHLAEGALAGFGAAELLRHHKKSSGKETSGPIGRLGKDVGAGVLGAAAASGLSRAKSQIRSKSRQRGRSVSFDRDDRRSRREKSRSRSSTRSHSHSRLKTLGGLGLAAAAAATVVAVAKKKKQKKESPSPERRSRSRHRSSSSSSSVDDARSPRHRKKRIAEAGAAGAAVAGLIEGARSRSRKRNGERSRSRIRTGLPIAAAGLGSAAIAGIYERNKAQREVETAALADRRTSRSRSRSRGKPAHQDVPRGSASNPNLIEYGSGAMYGQIPQADYYGRAPAPHDGYYSDAVVPTAAATAGVGAGHGARSARRSHSRDRRPSSSESSDGGRRRRHRRRSASQSRDMATPALAALGGGIAATEYAKRKEKKKDKARRRHEAAHGQDPYEDAYDPAPHGYTPTPPSSADPYHHHNQYYGHDEQLPPPPGSAPAPLYPPQQQQMPGFSPQQGPFQAQTGYNPASYSQPQGVGPPPPNQAYPPAQRPSPGVGYPQEGPYASGGNGDPRYPRGRGDENVSAPPNGELSPGEPRPASPDGLNRAPTSPARRKSRSGQRSSSQPAPSSAPKNVVFDLGSELSQASSPDLTRQPQRNGTSRGGETSGRGYEAEDDSESTLDGRDKRYPTHHPVSETESDPEKAARRQQRHRSRHRHLRRPGESADPTRPSPNHQYEEDEPHHRHRHRHRRSSNQQNLARGGVAGSDVPLSPTPSDVTVDLPDRFDKDGRKKAERGEDAVADFFEGMLSGKGPGSKYLKKIFGDKDGDDSETAREASGSTRRRRR